MKGRRAKEDSADYGIEEFDFDSDPDKTISQQVPTQTLRNEDLFNCKNIAQYVGSSSRRVSGFILYV